MNNILMLSIVFNFSKLSLEEGMELLEKICNDLSTKLSADNNGVYVSTGWLEGNGALLFKNIVDASKARKSVYEVIDDRSLFDFLVRIDFGYLDISDLNS